MHRIIRPNKVDLSRFSPGRDPKSFKGEADVKYGLPADVTFCKNCVYSNQKPNSAIEYKHQAGSKKSTLSFDENGLCTACQHALRKKVDIDWGAREQQLIELCNRYRRNDGQYDCLVPGSGGKDSFYTAHVLKYKYGMNPLTVTWAPHIYTDWGWKNFHAWINAGFDNYLFTPNGRVHRLLTRLALEKLFHPFQPFILGQYYFVSKFAMKMNLPLVFYGESAAEYGNSIEENSKATKDTKYLSSTSKADIYLGGTSLKELVEDYGLNEVDLDAYLPPRPEDLEAKKIEVHQLGYYLKWHPQFNYYYSVEHGFQASPERTLGTYSKYSSIDDKIDDFHYYTTFIKFGIGRATYDSAQEVRTGEITREEAIALIKRYDGEYPGRFEKEVFEYLSVSEKELPKAAKMFDSPKMDREYFSDLCDSFRSPHLWQFENNQWKIRKAISAENKS